MKRMGAESREDYLRRLTLDELRRLERGRAEVCAEYEARRGKGSPIEEEFLDQIRTEIRWRLT